MEPKHNAKESSSIQLKDVGIKGQPVKIRHKHEQKENVKIRTTNQGIKISILSMPGIYNKLMGIFRQEE